MTWQYGKFSKCGPWLTAMSSPLHLQALQALASPRETPKGAPRGENKENAANSTEAPSSGSVRASPRRAAASPLVGAVPRRALTQARCRIRAQILKRRRSAALLDVGGSNTAGRSPAALPKRVRQSLGGRRVSFAPEAVMVETRHFQPVRSVGCASSSPCSLPARPGRVGLARRARPAGATDAAAGGRG